jgi:hypothetical protein
MLEMFDTVCGTNRQNRIKEHLNCICLQKEVKGVHYNSSGHNHYNLKVQVIEKVSPNTPNFRLEREDYWIKQSKTLHKNTIWPKQTRLVQPVGLNKQD